MSDTIKNVKGELTFYKGRRPYKFCSECAFMMCSEQRKLVTHFGRHHTGKEARFLKYGEEPASSIYSNFQKLLTDPTVELQIIKDGKSRMYGRPTKDLAQQESDGKFKMSSKA